MSNVNPTGLHSLATIIKRLEAAASRFEDIALAIDPSTGTHRFESPRGSSASAPQATSTTHVHPAPPAPPPPPPAVTTTAAAPVSAPAAPEVPKTAVAFRERVIDAKVKPFINFTKEFAGPNVVEIVGLVQNQYDVFLDFLQLSASCQKPDQKGLEALLSPLIKSIEAISRAKEANRRDRDWFSHLTIISEGAPIIGWVVEPKPMQAVSDIKDSVVYYGNRVKQEYKDKNPKHIEWVNMYVAIFDATQAYIKEFFPTGLVWNAKGVKVEEYKAGSAPTAGSPLPPPPPPPPPPPAATTAAPAPAPAGGAAAVFAELNRGEEVTKGLRKVDKSEMTHKNPALRASSVVSASTSSTTVVPKKPIKPSKPQALAGKKPSKFVLDGNKWMVEHFEGETVTIENVEIGQSVNIYDCKGTVVLIKGKVNTVNILNSTKASVLVESVVASISVTKSPSFQLQITGKAPMIQVDSTDSGQIYLSKGSLDAEVTTAKCSAINISLPVPGEEDGIFEEQAVPEMFKTVVKDGKLVTTVVEHAG